MFAAICLLAVACRATADMPVSGWETAGPAAVEEVADISPGAVVLSTLEGDCWEELNTQQAVLLRDAPSRERYYVEATLDGFEPAGPVAQAGLVFWDSEDAYVRQTVGFQPPGMEMVAEHDGRAYRRGIGPIFPQPHPVRARLRMEAVPGVVFTYVTLNDGPECSIGAAALPGMPDGGFPRVGLIGVGGEAAAAPRFTDWQEGGLPEFQPDEFDDAAGGAPWRLMLGTPGWGGDQVRVKRANGVLRLLPFPGSDIYFGNASYPFVQQPLPEGTAWVMEVKLSGFVGSAPGRWRKGGVVLWEGAGRQLIVCLVTDDHQQGMWFELLADHGRPFMDQVGYRDRSVIDAFMRVGRLPDGRFRVKVGYDGKQWFDLGIHRVPIREGRLRLFASGDVLVQYPDDDDWGVSFDYVRLLPVPDKGVGP